MTRALPTIVTILLALIAAPAAQAARRYTAPTAAGTACSENDPCRIDRAINNAADGDEIIVGAGTYAVSTALHSDRAIDVRGDRDHAAPHIVGSATLSASLLKLKAGSVSHLTVESTAPKQEALTLEGGVAEGVRLFSAARGGTIRGSGTILRNSVVRGSTAGLMLDVKDGHATVSLRNVTVMAVGASSTGIDCQADHGKASLVNVLVRGVTADIAAHVNDGSCAVAFSNFRPVFSSGVAPGAGNQSAEPLFADDDYRPAPGSPTIDAGALDAFASSPDPDGRPRALGAAPDIGAYEFAPDAAGGEAEGPTAQLPEELQGVPLPKQGVSVLVAPARGTVRVREPGADGFSDLVEPGRIPVGSLIDAHRGRVQLVSAVDGGRVQSGLFWGSTFRTSQRRTGNGMTTLTLRGGKLGACKARKTLAVASRKRKRKGRSLWARDNGGRFRTHGNDSVATARGTAWLTRDTCRGTLTRVIEGSVSVRDLGRHKRVVVKAGHSYLARR